MTELDDEHLHPATPDSDEPEEVEVVFVPADAAERAKTVGVGVADMTLSANDPAARLEAARAHLRRNELDDALNIASELSRERPSLVGAKTVIARCFINRKDYGMAMATLKAVPDAEKDAEAFYYLGLCHGRMGDVPAAVAALERSLELAGGGPFGKRAGELLRHLRGGRAVCPECGGNTKYAAMHDIGDRTVCPDCARGLSGVSEKNVAAAPGARPDAKSSGSGFVRKTLRRAASLLVLPALAYAGLYAASLYLPAEYDSLRARLPDSWSFLPKTGRPANSIAESSEPLNRSLPASLVIDSPPIAYAVSGVPLVHRLRVDGMRGVDGEYEALFSPEPRGRHRMNGKTGEFRWTPGAEDAGKRFDLTFGATFAASRAREQVNRVSVFAAPRFQNMYAFPDSRPGDLTHILSGDLTRDGLSEIVVVGGGFWNGRVTVLQETADGFFHPLGRAEFSGRPAGAGLVEANGRVFLSVADYWNSRMRYFSVKDGAVAELPLNVPLPGRPVLAGFDRDSGVSAALCRLGDSMRLVAHRAVDATHVEKVGDWAVPAGHVWNSLVILPEDAAAGLRPRALLIGGSPEKSVFLASPEKGELVHVALPLPGVVRGASVSGDGVGVLLESDGEFSFAAFGLNADALPTAPVLTPLGNGPFLNGVASLKPFGPKGGDGAAVLSATRLGLLLPGGESVAQWDLPAPSRLLGSVAALKDDKGGPDRVVYQAADGGLWCAGLASAGGN